MAEVFGVPMDGEFIKRAESRERRAKTREHVLHSSHGDTERNHGEAREQPPGWVESTGSEAVQVAFRDRTPEPLAFGVLAFSQFSH